MKHSTIIKSIILVVFCLLAAMTSLSSSASIKIGNLYYNLNPETNTAVVTYMSMSAEENSSYVSGSLIIPDSVRYGDNTYVVTTIDYSAFERCTGLTNVSIPNTVNHIGSRAFKKCAGMHSVTLPNSIKTIQSGCFEECSGLKIVDIPNSVIDIGWYAFSNCTNLTNVTISDSVTMIGLEAFDNCSSLRSITIPNSVISIGSSAFKNCTSLTTVILPDSLKIIDNSVFEDCSSLKNISLPNTIKRISMRAFSGCVGLTNITLPKSLHTIESNAFEGCSGLSSITLPSSIISIEFGTFRNCSSLISVEFPKYLSNIGNDSFSGCASLKEISLPNSVTSIGYNAFSGCVSLANVKLSESITSIGRKAFFGCSALTNIIIPEKVKKIEYSAFSGTGLKVLEFNAKNCSTSGTKGSPAFPSTISSLTIGDKVEVIPSCFLNNAKQLENLIIPNSVYSIRDNAFYGCSGLTNVILSNSVDSIGEAAFSHCSGLKGIRLPDSIERIGPYAFSYCSGLKEVRLPNSIEKIEPYTFSNCSGLTNVIIPNSVKSIETYAFEYCSGLTSVVIPTSVTKVGYSPFSNCENLKKCAYPSSIKCPFGKGVNVPYPMDCFIDDYGVIYNGDKSKVCFAPLTLPSSYAILDSVISIGESAFRECAGMKNIIFPLSASAIEGFAFANCTGLSEITIPDSLKYIGTSAFQNCTGLVNVGFSNHVTSIGDRSFAGCSKLKSVKIPVGVTSIGGEAFAETGLESIVFEALECSVCGSSSSPSFPSSISKVTIGNEVRIIPQYFLCNDNQVESLIIPASVTKIGGGAFSGTKLTSLEYNVRDCTNSGYSTLPIFPPTISSLTIGDEVISIPKYFLSGGSKIESLSIPVSVTSINRYAFINNALLENVTLPDSLTFIGEKAFYGCTALKSITIPKLVKQIDEQAFVASGLTTLIFNAQVCFLHFKSPFPPTISTLTIGEEVSHIPANFLDNGSQIESITIPNSVQYINSRAFQNDNSKLKSLTIGSGVTMISPSAFSLKSDEKKPYKIPKVFWMGNRHPQFGCEEVLAEINYVPNDSYKYQNMHIYPFLSSKFSANGIVCIPVSPSDRTCDIVDCEYSSSCTEIDLSGSVSNKGIDMSVLNINPYSFYDNDHIKNLVVSNIKEIGDHAFCDCGSLEFVRLSNKGNIGIEAFFGCDMLQKAVIENSGNIEERAFYDCDNLESIKISNNGNIGEQAFYDCGSLASIKLYNKGNIGSDAFGGCHMMQKAVIDISGNIGERAFYGLEKLNSVELGSGVTGILPESFYGCSALTKIDIPDSVTELGKSAFQYCKSIESLRIGTSVSSLPDSVFSGCYALSSLFIPNNISSIGDYALSGCFSLKNVEIEDTVKIVGNSIAKVFPDWTSTNHADASTSFVEYKFDVVAGDVLTLNYNVSSELQADYLIIKLDGKEILKESGTKSGSYTNIFNVDKNDITLHIAYVKDGSRNEGFDMAMVKDICLNGESGVRGSLELGSNGKEPLFSDCPLHEIYIGRKLSYRKSSDYGYSPFYGNEYIRTVEISDAETQIYDNEFYGCSKLSSFTIGNGVKKIGDRAFAGCSLLNTFSVGPMVESIGKEAFVDCRLLSKLYSYSKVPPVCEERALDDIDKWHCTLYVPADGVEAYKKASQWKEFFFIEEAGDVSIDEIRLNVSEATLAEGETLQLVARILPSNATNKDLEWSSSDEKVISVSDTGLVTAKAMGKAIVIVRNINSNVRAYCTVTVNEGSGVVNVSGEEDGPIEVYNLNGLKVADTIDGLAPGVYIVRQGSKAYKISVR